jgi:hypothetical protein
MQAFFLGGIEGAGGWPALHRSADKLYIVQLQCCRAGRKDISFPSCLGQSAGGSGVKTKANPPQISAAEHSVVLGRYSVPISPTQTASTICGAPMRP